MNKKIWLSLAHMGGHEQVFIKEAFDTNWVVPLGPNVNAFEKNLSEYLEQDKHIVALSSGTAAIHLALVMLGVKTGDEVICQSFTFSASANPIEYLGATPIFVDSEEDTWNMSPKYLEQAIVDRKFKTGNYPRAIIVVHLYGMPAKIDEIISIADRYGIPVLEDAAEALGSEYKGKKCGTFGAYGVLSFNGNKIITTSGGGALICADERKADRVMFYATQARENKPYYYHKEIGYNYRMSNVCAGIGRGQMMVLKEHLNRRRQIHELYSELLKEVKGIIVMQAIKGDFFSNYWLTCILIDAKITGKIPIDVMRSLTNANIESRLLWRPMHLQPIFEDKPYYGNKISESIYDRGLCLPSGSILEDRDIERVVSELKKSLV